MLKHGSVDFVKKSSTEVVYIDDSLGMPLGKKCAQVAHGLMKLVLDRFFTSGSKLKITDSDSLGWLLEWQCNGFDFEIKHLPSFSLSSPELNSGGTYAYIYDQGRTCFFGKTTLTVIAYSKSKLATSKRETLKRTTESTDKEARQFILVDRKIDYQENAEDLIKASAKASLLNLLRYLKEEEGCLYFDLEKEPILSDWVLGSFAKITLSLKGNTKYLNALSSIKELEVPSAIGISNSIEVSAFGPCRKDDILHITKKMKLF